VPLSVLFLRKPKKVVELLNGVGQAQES
jgi:hypothetical protein